MDNYLYGNLGGSCNCNDLFDPRIRFQDDPLYYCKYIMNEEDLNKVPRKLVSVKKKYKQAAIDAIKETRAPVRWDDEPAVKCSLTPFEDYGCIWLDRDMYLDKFWEVYNAKKKKIDQEYSIN